jgi:hypothetical protein
LPVRRTDGQKVTHAAPSTFGRLQGLKRLMS